MRQGRLPPIQCSLEELLQFGPSHPPIAAVQGSLPRVVEEGVEAEGEGAGAAEVLLGLDLLD